jgi:hypothetical protein
MKTLQSTVLALILGASASSSMAAISAYHVRSGNFSSPVVAGVLVPLNAAGQTTITFNARKAGQRLLTFSAECAVGAPAGDEDAWLDIDILVNGVAQAPTAGSGDAFCSANGTAATDHWIRPSITIRIPVIEGANSVSVQARGNAGATLLWIGDSSLVVHK